MTKVIALTTNDIWGVTEGQIYQQKKIYFRNGEHHCLVADDDGKEFDIPLVFVKEAYRTTEWHITGDCPECDGMGWFENCSSPWSGDTTCPLCDGTGEYTHIETLHENEESVRKDFPHGKIEKKIREY